MIPEESRHLLISFNLSLASLRYPCLVGWVGLFLHRLSIESYLYLRSEFVLGQFLQVRDSEMGFCAQGGILRSVLTKQHL